MKEEKSDQRTWWRWLKITVAVVLLGFLVSRLEMPEVLRMLREADLLLLGLSLVFFVVSALVEFERFRCVCQDYGMTYLESMRVVSIGVFMSNFLPSNVGGDSYKVLYLKNRDKNWSRPFARVVFERFSGLAVLLLVGGICALIDYQEISLRFSSHLDEMRFSLNIKQVFLAGGTVLVIVGGLFAAFNKPSRRLLSILFDFCVNCWKAGMTLNARQLAVLFFTSLFFHLGRLLSFHFALLAFGETIPLTGLMVILMVVAIVSLLPVSFGALGVREGVLVLSFMAYDVGYTAAIAVALTHLVYIWLQGLLGGWFYLLGLSRMKG